MTAKSFNQNWFVWGCAFIFAAGAHTALALVLNSAPAALDVQVAGEPIAIELALLTVEEPAASAPEAATAEPIEDAAKAEIALADNAEVEPDLPNELVDETRETAREPEVQTAQILTPLLQLPSAAPQVPAPEIPASEIAVPTPPVPEIAVPELPDRENILPAPAAAKITELEPVLEATPAVPDAIKPEVALALPVPPLVETPKQVTKPIVRPKLKQAAPKPKTAALAIKTKPKNEVAKKPKAEKPAAQKQAAKTAEAKENPKAKPNGKPKAKSNPKTTSGGKTAKGDKTGVKRPGKSAAATNTASASIKAGNAAASNYPGKIYSKIRRTRQKSAGGSGAAIVAFSVGAGGQIISISVAGSSGNASLDRAALDHIRRAAPFPPPPNGAQTRFNIPIEFRR